MEVLELKEFRSFCEENYGPAKQIPVVDANTLSYQEFVENFIVPNRACLIKNVDDGWNAYKDWTVNGIPNFAYLNEKYGESTVTVQDCNQRYYNSQKASKWIFKNYLKYWEDYRNAQCPTDMPLYYLKDWHLKNEIPDDKFYNVPNFFSSDWLNEYCVENSLDDYRFVYMGPQGTWTPLHADVMCSYSWSTNICGQKRWMLFPPGEENGFRDHLRNVPYDITNLKLNCTVYEFIQNPGETIFVPSEWYHQVWNLKDTISINHNWINGCNISIVWDAMEKAMKDVKNEIKDCEEMDGFIDNCQTMLKATFGMDFHEFYNFISYIIRKRLNYIHNGNDIIVTENRILGKSHVLFDLKMLQWACELFKGYDDVQKLGLRVKIETLLKNIQLALEIGKT